MSQKQDILEEIGACFRLPPPLKPSEWASRFFYVPAVVSAQPGRMSFDLHPWQPEMLDTAIDPTIDESIWCLASQIAGKSQAALALIGYHIDWAPSTVLVKYPTAGSAESWSKEKFQPSIAATPVLRHLVSESKGRDSANTITYKAFRQGFLACCGAESVSELRKRSVRIVIQDEIDGDVTSNSEGSPVQLADQRANSFSNAVKIKISTPTEKPFGESGGSQIWRLWEASDQRHWHVVCPHCGTEQHLTFNQLKWELPDAADAYLECKGDRCKITDAERQEAVRRGRWKATAESASKKAGFHLNYLYRLHGLRPLFVSLLQQCATEWKEASKTEGTLRVFTNTLLCLPWSAAVEKLDAQPLLARRENYTGIPNPVLLLLATVDVQGDRLEAELVGYGKHEQSWGLDYSVFDGNPEQPGVWTLLDKWLTLPRQRDDGTPLDVFACAIDSGHLSDSVYRYCFGKAQRRVYAVKGRGSPPNLPIYWKPKHGGVRGVILLHCGTNAAKQVIYSRLQLGDSSARGYCHFPTRYPASYFEQLTAETVEQATYGGQTYQVFRLPHAVRNEALDLRVYQLCLLRRFAPNFDRLAAQFPIREATQPTSPAATVVIGNDAKPISPIPLRRQTRRIKPASGWL